MQRRRQSQSARGRGGKREDAQVQERGYEDEWRISGTTKKHATNAA
jgi:hypothetical protein